MVIQISDYDDYMEFYKLPKALIKNPAFRKLSSDTKIAYALLLDRTKLSKENKWFDDVGVFQYFTVNELAKALGVSNKTAIKTKKELAECGLILEKRQFDKPNKIYVNRLSDVNVKSTFTDVNNLHHTSVKSTFTDVNNLHSINTNNINTNISRLSYPDNNNNTNIIYSAFEQEFGRLLSPFEIEDVGKMIEENSEELVTEALREAVRQHKPTIKYVNGILNNWKLDNLTTVDMVRNSQQKRTRNRKSDDGFVYDEQYNFEQWGGENE